MELLGNESMVTVRLGQSLVAVKAAKDFRATIGHEIGLRVPASACHLFDRDSSQRLAH